MPPAASSSSTRALNAILPQIQSSPYEAHQKARTFASRYVKSNQFDTAIDVLFQSSRELLKNGQAGSGVDLASFLLDVYESKGEKVSDESKGRVTQLIALTGPSGSWRKTLIDKALAWSAKHGPYPAGDPALQHYMGELLYKEGQFEAAELHLLASGTRDSARLLAEMFIQWGTPSNTFGSFALRGTIPALQNGNILAARSFINQFVSSLPGSVHADTAPISIGSNHDLIVTKDSLVNFAQLAVSTCQRAQGDKNKVMRESWVRLCGTYQSRGGVLAQPEVRKVLNEIALLFFSIPPPRNQAVNPFGDMLSSLLGGEAPGGQSARRVLSPPPAAITGLD
ncbi:cytoplasm protein [Moniliophthora roreri MCA 2997]|uniref:Cytoplasm protein n=2 Tax=Moniliophthora roreri TaxID=221103 RepID=V2X9N3_MONRO|nr:cytoplasm protein [Moniliophthora roreri MCA 2997]KAI3615886.1 cytoplasm protein [Moniliophthora roreri]